MKSLIYIPFQHYTSIGGPSTFMGNLRRYLDSVHYPYATTPKDAWAIFFPISHDLETVKKIKGRGGKVIQRLDGVYYPSQHGPRFEELNRPFKEIYQSYADIVVFQSNYSRNQNFTMFGEKERHEYVTILNGAATGLFFPSDQAKTGGKFRFVTTGDFRKKVMIEPIVNALDSLMDRFEFELVILGTISLDEIRPLFDRRYISFLGKKDIGQVADILRTCHIYVHSQLNDNCPNAVIEAISCGLPVVGFDSGAMSELCFFSEELLAHVPEGTFHTYEDFNHRKLAEKLLFAADHYEGCRRKALAHARLYSFEECGKRYVEVFERVMAAGGGGRGSTASEVKESIREHLSSSVVNTHTTHFFERWLLKKGPEELAGYLHRIIKEKSEALSPFDALKFLFDIEHRNYQLEGRTAVRYGNGIHTKHWHIKYHDFFIENTPPESRVLDLGCGIGALAYDIAEKVQGASVCGIDVDENNIRSCRERFRLKNIRYVHGDALSDLPDEHFDVIILSNVLEHIEKRVEFLRALDEKYKPGKILIRVPMFERDWRVPLKKEVGFDYRLDETHYIEYSRGDFFNEIKKAGMSVLHHEIAWGEIWAAVTGQPR
jgi:2-polyprenyl-3-methyl-5-hydroxy-6-metoxy-1,4-benzoquinol methylase/glycosyltransferase involved in cell wall biosynthesis